MLVNWPAGRWQSDLEHWWIDPRRWRTIIVQLTLNKPISYRVTSEFQFLLLPQVKNIVLHQIVFTLASLRKIIPHSRPTLSEFYMYTQSQTKQPENHTLYSSTYPYSSKKNRKILLRWTFNFNNSMFFSWIFITGSFICQQRGLAYLKKSLLTILSTCKCFIFHREFLLPCMLLTCS